jgi:hypothetical protein
MTVRSAHPNLSADWMLCSFHSELVYGPLPILIIEANHLINEQGGSIMKSDPRSGGSESPSSWPAGSPPPRSCATSIGTGSTLSRCWRRPNSREISYRRKASAYPVGPKQTMRFAPGRAFVASAGRIDSNHDARRSVGANGAVPRDLRGHYFRDRAKRHCGFRDAVPDQRASVSQIVSTIAQEVSLTDQKHLTSIFHHAMPRLSQESHTNPQRATIATRERRLSG